MTRVLKNTRIKGLPPRVQLRTKDAVTGSYPAHARTASDNRTGTYRTFFDDTKTVDFKSYALTAASAASYGPGFNAQGTYTGYTIGSQVILWLRFEDVISDGHGGLGTTDQTGDHNATFFTNTYALSTSIPGYYNNVRDTFGNAFSLHITGTVGNQTVSDFYSTNKSQLNFTGNKAFTLSAHVKFDSLGTINPVIYRGIWASGKPDWLICVTSAGRIQFSIHTSLGAAFVGYESDDSGLIVAGVWNHIAITFDGSSSAIFYLNGGAIGSSASDTGGIWADFSPGNNDFYVGAMADNDFNSVTTSSIGYFDQVLVAHSVATPTEINFLYSGAPIPGDVFVPAVEGVGLALPSGLHTSNAALRRVDATGSFVLNHEMVTDIIVGSPIRKGIGDSWITFTPGQDLLPFRDNGHPAVDGKSVISGSTQNAFYATGSRVADVGEGFSQPLWAKTKLEIDLTPTTEHSFSLQNGAPGATGVNYPVAYWNNVTRKYEGIGTGKVFHSYVSGATAPDRLLNLQKFLEDQCIIFGESLFEILGTPNPQLNESRGQVVSNWGFPYHPKFHATSSNSIAVSDLVSGPFLVEKIVLEFSGAFGLGTTYAASKAAYSAACAGFFILNQKSPFLYNNPTAQTMQYLTPTITNLISGAFIPGEGTLANTTARDLIGTLRIASFVADAPFIATAQTEMGADLNLVVGALGVGPPTWSGRYIVSGTIKSQIANQGMQSIITNTGIATTALLLKLQNSNRSGLFGASGRSQVSDFSSGEIARSVTQDGWTFNVLRKYTKPNPYIIQPGDRLIIGWQPPWSRIVNETTLGVTEFPGQGAFLKFAAAPAKLTIYGSHISEGKEHHDTLNQLLTSQTVSEVIE